MCLYNMINLLISQQNGSLATVVNLTTVSNRVNHVYPTPPPSKYKNLHNSQQAKIKVHFHCFLLLPVSQLHFGHLHLPTGLAPWQNNMDPRLLEQTLALDWSEAQKNSSINFMQNLSFESQPASKYDFSKLIFIHYKDLIKDQSIFL